MIFECIQAVLAVQLSTVYAACVSKCMDLKGSDGNTWKDKDDWTCQMYQDSAYKGIYLHPPRNADTILHAMHDPSQFNAE